MEWRTIDSAPKSVADGRYVDGIYILGYMPADEIQEDPERVAVIWWEPLLIGKNGKRGKWVSDVYACEGEVRPTHWMPLPEPPKQNGE
jgi:hypothetical protein